MLSAHRETESDSRSSAMTNWDRNELKVDAIGNVHSQAAHLLSHAPKCHKAYGYPCEAATGKKADDAALYERAPKRRKHLVGVKGGQETSLKGHRFNKCTWGDQGAIFNIDD